MTELAQRNAAGSCCSPGQVAQELNLTSADVLDYLWWDTLEAERENSKEFLVGVDPAAYISQK